MPKTKISEYSTTNSQNTDIQSINIDEGCAPSGINNAIRELMVHLRNFQTNASGDGATLASLVVQGTGSFTGSVTLSGGATLSGTNTLSGSNIMSGNINSSGTNTFSGSQVISGNINSSGTTNTFSGGNILSGTNTLSGSTIISGNFNATGTTNTFSNALILGNNLTFSGTGNRITGDFSNATIANRVIFQSSTTNGNTVLGVMPNGTGVTALVVCEDNASVATGNGAFVSFGMSTGSSALISSSIRGTGTYLPFVIQTGGSERMRIDTSGNVGIGTSSPSTKLHVNSGRTSLIANNEPYAIGVGYTSGGGVGYFIGSDSANTSLVFSNASGTERMRIDSSGNVGINTTSPASKLDISTGSSTGTTDMITLSGLDSGSAKQTYGVIRMGIENNTASSEQGNIVLQTVESGTIRDRININGSGYISFINGGTERARITSGGVFCFGKTSDSNTTAGSSIGTSGGANFVASTASPLDGPQIQVVNIASSVANGYRFYSFRINSGATEVGSIATNGSNATSYVTSSDYRLKENVAPMTNALSKIAQLKPSTWTWKNGGTNGQGFIAHELAEVCPDAVVGEKDAVEIYTDDEGNEQTRPRYQGVDTSFLVATLTAAIQELKSELDAAKARIAALESN